MLDANASRILIGKKYFAVVESIDPQLAKFGICKGDVVLCANISRTCTRPSFTNHAMLWTYQDKDEGAYDYYITEDSIYGLLRYIGLPNGKDFINDEHKQKAFEFMDGVWETKKEEG